MKMKALALLSGGLDSTLAIRVVLSHGIDIIAVNFSTPFCLCNRKNNCRSEARRVCEEFGIELKVVALFGEYIEIIKNPKYGYGSNLNPCIDCRILMFRYAKNLMQESGASFVITGEVLGQRPMSQHRNALKIIEKESGLEGLILRPLSAKLLPLSIPEKEGWVKRESLLEISGRSRRLQMAKALDYGIGDYPCPAGGCLLTDAVFASRMKDLMSHSKITLNNIELLKIGRHFRLPSQTKAIIGRNKDENEKLLRLSQKGDIYFSPVEVKGPAGIGRGNLYQEDIVTISRIIARYCDGHSNGTVKIGNHIWPDGKIQLLHAIPMQDVELQELRI